MRVFLSRQTDSATLPRNRGRPPRDVGAVHQTSSMADSGAGGFDFLHGSWRVHNRKLRNVADRTCTEWIEFEGRSEVTPILFGGGNFDRMIVDSPPDGAAFEGDTLRIFDPESGEWSIWWTSTRVPGKLDIPVRGRFDGDQGIFECDDEVAGHPIVTRFEWFAGEQPQWQQSFSYERGVFDPPNWAMTFSRD